jgi:hypothetical protein
MTGVAPTAPSVIAAAPPTLASTQVAASPQPTHAAGPAVPTGLTPAQQVMTGTVGPLASYAQPCYLERYACERYGFTMQHDGAVEVTLSWEGGSRAMLIQLYRAGAGLVHEDLAPKDGAPTITFRRTDIAAMAYELRVVNMETGVAHPFTLTLTTWQ